MRGDTIAEWTDDEKVHDAVAALATEAAVAHRLRWRLRHLRCVAARTAEAMGQRDSGKESCGP
ncbi:hypothetical protein ABZY16_35415 [Streptomyces sp. NPDC006553]|uniref:hypothetical protein n=1 Tax=Streptomyces sp. NPDC006553 TaxID=3157180 RepID=UPI0033B9C29B